MITCRIPLLRTGLFISMLYAFLVCQHTAHAATVTVTSAADSGPGTLRDAVHISNAADGDTIVFNLPGTGPWTITLAGDDIEIYRDNITIQGPGPSLLTLDANYGSRIFTFRKPATISGLTLTRGTGSGTTIPLGGGAIHAMGSLTVNNCVITKNKALNSDGGGIYLSAGAALTLTSSEISDNTAVGAIALGGGISANGPLTISDSIVSLNVSGNMGGGINNFYTGWSSITGTTFTSNWTYNGGGAIYSSGSLSMTDCTLDDNRTTGNNGGGVYMGTSSSPTLIMTRCTIKNNHAQSYGGGVHAGYATLTDCSFVGNSTELYNGGGAYFSGGTVDGCLFQGNTSGGSGGGIYAIAGNGGALIILNSTFFQNMAGVSGGAAVLAGSSGSQAHLFYSTITGNRCDEDVNGSGSGGGIFASDIIQTFVKSTIIADNYQKKAGANVPDDGYGPFTSIGYNLVGAGTVDLSGFSNGANNDQVGTVGSPIDPLLSFLQENGGSTLTMLPAAASPAIDAGGPATNTLGYPVAVDQRNESRLVGTYSDIGACEVGLFPWAMFLPSIVTH